MVDEEKTRLNLKVSVMIDNDLTWQELFDFVDLARRHVPDPARGVGLEFDPFDNNGVIRGLNFFLDGLAAEPGG